MNVRILGVGTLAGLAIGWRSTAPLAVCMPSDIFSEAVLARVQTIVTSTDTAMVSLRGRLAWPATSASSVSYVTDNAVCAAAEPPYTASILAAYRKPPSGSVYVWKIGSVYWVRDTVQHNGEFGGNATLSGEYKVLASFTW